MNFQEHDFLRDLNFPLLLLCCVAGKKKAGFSNPVRNRALESFSNKEHTLTGRTISYSVLLSSEIFLFDDISLFIISNFS